MDEVFVKTTLPRLKVKVDFKTFAFRKRSQQRKEDVKVSCSLLINQ